MSKLAHVALVAMAASALAACRKDDRYCPGAPLEDCTLIDAPNDDLCTGDQECEGTLGVCDLASMMCVQCTSTQLDACGPTTPACVDHTCQRCTAHTQCASNACLPDGSCGNDTNVAYVDPAGTSPMCTKTAPCQQVAEALATGRPFVKFHGATVAESTVTLNDASVTLLADPSAKLSNKNSGVVLEVRGASNVSIYDLEIGDGLGAPVGIGISMPAGNAATLELKRVKLTNNAGGGIAATGGTLTVSASTIFGNQGAGISASAGTLTVSASTISGNQGGGISLTAPGAKFDITNNFIFRNGNSTNASIGGASLRPATGSTSRFEFNTVVDNQITNSVAFAGGVFCDTSGFTAPNNIIARNFVNNDAAKANSNTIGLCSYPTTTISQAITDLKFISADDNPYNYHILTGSSAIDRATTSSTIQVDIDGNARPQGPAADQGADELK